MGTAAERVRDDKSLKQQQQHGQSKPQGASAAPAKPKSDETKPPAQPKPEASAADGTHKGKKGDSKGKNKPKGDQQSPPQPQNSGDGKSGDTNKPTQCKFYMSAEGCRNGAKCKFFHPNVPRSE
eukprot:1753111-Amphidinium_carterae.1